MSALDLEAAAVRLDEIAPGYLDRIRRRAAEIAVPRTPLDRARKSIDLLTEVSQVDPNAPVDSDRRSGRFLKRVVRKLTFFSIRFITQQTADLGESASWMGTALCDYVAGLESEVVSLRERVTRLEEASGRS